LKKYFLLVLFLPLFVFAQGKQNYYPDPHRFDREIENFIHWDEKNSFPENAVLFIGSSSIRMWKTRNYFPEYKVINRGFGGSHISDILFFFDDVVKKYNPGKIVFYAGDNDIAAGKSPEVVFKDFKNFVKLVHDSLGNIEIYYLPIKPSISRWSFWEKMNETNLLIKKYCEENSSLFYVDVAVPMLNENGKPKKDIFIKDGLHLNEKGYEIWTKILKKFLN